MNDHLTVGPHGLRLLTDYEKGPDDGSVPLSPGGAALAPYVCPGGELTIGYGCTKWFDGEDVEIHHRLRNEDEALALLDYQLDPYEAAVKRLAKRPMTQNQYAALVALCYNIGEANFASSEVLREFNEGRMENAAAAFGNWTGATCDRPPKRWPRGSNPADYESKMVRDHKGAWRWKGPEGQYCRYMLRYVGLLSRHDAEALLFMGKDWTRALSENGVKLFLTPTHPDKARWNPLKGRWEDNVKDKTMFKDVLAFAYYDDLPVMEAPTKPAHAQTPVLAPTEPARIEAHRAPLPDSPAPSLSDAVQSIPTQLPLPDQVEDELFLETRAPVGTEVPAGAVGSSAPQPPATPPAQTVSVSGTSAPEKAGRVDPLPPKPPPVLPSPLPPPKLPDPPVPISQQTGAVEAARKSEDWSASAKAMWQSRRFWGLVLVMGGRLWMLKTGSNVVLGAVSDPLVTEMFSGFMVMIVGELIQHWGERKATRPLR